MDSITNVIGNLLNSSAFKYEIKRIQSWASDELYKAVLNTVYSQPEGDSYTRTYDLLASILPTDLVVTNSTIEFKVIFDESVMNHTTLFGSKKYGLNPGDPIGGLIVPFLNEGWRWSGYEGKIDNFHAREGARFLEEAIAKIQADVSNKVKGLIKSEVNKIGGKYK
jgi:hypothetical protein